MKKGFALMIALLWIAAGSAGLAEAGAGSGGEAGIGFGTRITLGRYEQNGVESDGAEDIRWIVLEVQDGRALLLSELVLDAEPYHNRKEDVTWETCSLRSWLNQDFWDAAFSEEEKSAVLLTETDNESFSGRGNVTGGNNTLDHVFALSAEEKDRYLSQDRIAACMVTEYAQDRGTAIDKNLGSAEWWWLRTPGTLQSHALGSDNRSGDVGRNVKDSSGGVRPAVWVDTDSPVFRSALEKAAQPLPTVIWREYELTPMHYEFYHQYFYPQLRIRFVCEDVPLRLLYDERESFVLTGPDGEEVLRSESIRVMESDLTEYNAEGYTDFFDIVFPCAVSQRRSIRSCMLQLGEEGERIALPPRGQQDTERCAFVTGDGVYVISLYSRNAVGWIARKYEETFRGTDVKICLGGYMEHSQQCSFLSYDFLNRFEFDHLDLTLSTDLSLWQLEHPELLGEVTTGDAPFRGEVYPGVRKMTWRLDRENTEIPDFDAFFPNLEELTLLIGIPEDNGNIVDESRDLINNVSSTLTALTVIGPEEPELPADPELRAWLEAQRERTPWMTLNGKDADGYDLTAGLEGDDLLSQQAYAVRKEAAKLLRAAERSAVLSRIAADQLEGKILICVTGKDADNIRYTSAETSQSVRRMFEKIPGDVLTASPEKAGTLIRIYPASVKVGSYRFTDTNKLYADAYACETHMAVYALRDGKAVLLADEVVYTDYPPANYEFSGIPPSTTGNFDPDRAVKLLSSLLSGN